MAQGFTGPMGKHYFDSALITGFAQVRRQQDPFCYARLRVASKNPGQKSA
jgi:hypothetical protein